MRGEVEEHHFGSEGEITLLLYLEGAYLKGRLPIFREGNEIFHQYTAFREYL